MIKCKNPSKEEFKDLNKNEREIFESEFFGAAGSYDGNGFKQKREKFKILLAEDNLINQKVTIKILGTYGFNVTAVSDGDEAVSAVTNGDFDLVLMDLQMPKVDGFKATDRIRALPNSRRDIPIIALTAHALIGDREKCLNAGMTDYISKPVSGQDLVKKIDVLLDIRSDGQKQKAVVPTNGNHYLDAARLKNVSLGDKEFEKDLLVSFLTDLDDKYKHLTELLTKHDLVKIVETVHSIKGSSYSVGATKVGDEAYAIELSGKNNDWVNVNARIEKFNKIINETNKEIKNYLSQQ
jgi:CheY-like chemotaxis protein/HPt (histidine-containing phosphotransfer) domain-containing protein